MKYARLLLTTALSTALAACGVGQIDGELRVNGGGEDVYPETPDAGVTQTPRPDAAPPPVNATAIAPAGTVAGEHPLADGATGVKLNAGQSAVYRLDSQPGMHIGFQLTFPQATSGVDLGVDRWNGAAPVELGATDAGPGIRVLAIMDQGEPRTFWVRIAADNGVDGILTVTRTPFREGSNCVGDCDRLLQLPLANDPAVDGYDHDGGTIFRYTFGRRDMLMFLRHTGRERAAHGKAAFFPYDLSQWNGETPGTDVGAPRHLSHQRGKDADISLYGLDHRAHWRSFCTTRPADGGRECVPGSRTGFDGYETAREIAGFLQSGRITMCFLDRERIAAAAPGAQDAADDGFIDPALVKLYSDGVHIQHWPNHDNHVHVRVSEAPYNGRPILDLAEPFEAP